MRSTNFAAILFGCKTVLTQPVYKKHTRQENYNIRLEIRREPHECRIVLSAALIPNVIVLIAA